jgi:hypothetical protein
MTPEQNFDNVVEAIKSERQYQRSAWPKSKKLPPTGEITLVRDYIREFDMHYRESDDGPEDGVPPECMHDIRKMAAILFRCMENHGVDPR